MTTVFLLKLKGSCFKGTVLRFSCGREKSLIDKRELQIEQADDRENVPGFKELLPGNVLLEITFIYTQNEDQLVSQMCLAGIV